MKTIGKIILLFIPLSFAFFGVEGQTGSNIKYAKFAERDIQDKAMMECIYEYSITDNNVGQTFVYFNILQIGYERSKYSDYGFYKIDSVIYMMDITRITLQEALSISNKYRLKATSHWQVFKDYKRSDLVYYDRIFSDIYFYADTVLGFNWQLLDDTATVCGYLCSRAEMSFRGRDWVAWYTPEIPVNDGPWKFSGLPGLILKIEDKDSEHQFIAISVRKAESDIYLKQGIYFKTNRERFNKQLKEYKTDPGSFIKGSAFAAKDVVTGKELEVPKVKRFFNPVELE